MVEGYTDTDPIVYSGWPSNWHLGAARAIAVLQYINGQGIAPARCGATTYSEYRPVEPNATPEGKTKNRRVVVLIMAEGATAPAEGETLVSRGVYRLPRDLGGAQ
jgi:chemotaxis protein MotB